MFKKIFSIYYYDNMILEMIKSTKPAVAISNFIGALLSIYILYGYVPAEYLTFWFMLHISIMLLRLDSSKKLLDTIVNKKNIKRKYFKRYIFTTTFTAFLYGSISWLGVLYAVPHENIFIISSGVLVITAGAMATMGVVYIAFFLFMSFSIIPFALALLYTGDINFIILASMLCLYFIINNVLGYRLFLFHKKFIESEKNLEELNNTLEKRINIEVEKNRVYDQKIVEQSRLAQMGEMLSMIAHQWRQPLAAISAVSSSLELKVRLDKLDNDYVLSSVKNISKYSQHLSETIDDFRDFFKSEKVKIETSFFELVESVLSIIEVSIKTKNIDIIQQFDSRDKFYSFSNELKQVIINLIKNAEDILVEKGIQQPYIKIFTYKQDDDLVLEISDNGGGVDKDILEKIFDPYFSTKKTKNGTGLGLYMSKIIIQEHCNGILSASNNADGAVFKIVLKG